MSKITKSRLYACMENILSFKQPRFCLFYAQFPNVLINRLAGLLLKDLGITSIRKNCDFGEVLDLQGFMQLFSQIFETAGEGAFSARQCFMFD